MSAPPRRRRRALEADAHRHHGDAGFGTELELVVEDRLQALLGPDDEHDLGDLAADLQADAARAHAVEDGIAPVAGLGARQQHTAAAGRAQDEAALDELGHDQHASGAGHQADGVGEVLAAQHLAGGLARQESTSDWRLASARAGRAVIIGAANAAAAPGRTVRRSSFIFCSLAGGRRRGSATAGLNSPNNTMFRGRIAASGYGGPGGPSW